eukprot:1161962-Pelagomonas_calceolata.AAC.8
MQGIRDLGHSSRDNVSISILVAYAAGTLKGDVIASLLGHTAYHTAVRLFFQVHAGGSTGYKLTGKADRVVSLSVGFSWPCSTVTADVCKIQNSKDHMQEQPLAKSLTSLQEDPGLQAHINGHA